METPLMTASSTVSNILIPTTEFTSPKGDIATTLNTLSSLVKALI